MEMWQAKLIEKKVKGFFDHHQNIRAVYIGIPEEPEEESSLILILETDSESYNFSLADEITRLDKNIYRATGTSVSIFQYPKGFGEDHRYRARLYQKTDRNL